jgi:hypothetical protein
MLKSREEKDLIAWHLKVRLVFPNASLAYQHNQITGQQGSDRDRPFL